MRVMGIESSCDETAVAIVDGEKRILSNIIVSQIDIHKIFGGVVPEIASRNHLDVIDKAVETALRESGLLWKDIDAIASATGPGLIGGLIVGALTGRTIASVLEKPFIPVNHLEGHLLTTRLTNNVEFPFLSFLISGGHTQILLVKGVGNYEKIGETIDDSLGECFDKVGQMLKLEYPAGPKIEQLAKDGNENKYKLIKPLINAVGKKKTSDNKYNFSFSGLKTSARIQIEKMQNMTEQDRKDFCASFQKTVLDILKNRFENVMNDYLKNNKEIKNLVFAGGVAANQYIRNGMIDLSTKYNLQIISPPIKICTDNAVMIAWAAIERYKSKMFEKNNILEIKSTWDL
ncbi:MAG: tRNA (adenosine(37)-N6)-threonylcarbamoyltransferase complex transferase subunit TsaD [Rickettsiales bacterium]|jgi:N6-L-threonylcarbamoyladenine synthase|nr:tRNA (adenosine(37)-N6)-threonylcarbamoyltransferase complex transferase subunit TsaD [Rickettsiales bacterium]